MEWAAGVGRIAGKTYAAGGVVRERIVRLVEDGVLADGFGEATDYLLDMGPPALDRIHDFAAGAGDGHGMAVIPLVRVMKKEEYVVHLPVVDLITGVSGLPQHRGSGFADRKRDNMSIWPEMCDLDMSFVSPQCTDCVGHGHHSTVHGLSGVACVGSRMVYAQEHLTGGRVDSIACNHCFKA